MWRQDRRDARCGAFERNMKEMKILYVGAEALPFASTGGLGDVMGSLPAALASSDESLDVRAVMPLYSKIAPMYRDKMTKIAEFTVRLGWRQQYCGVWRLVKDNVIWYFVDNEYYFKRDGLYGYYDDGERYAYFCMAVLEMMSHIGFYPDVLHANDWHTALSVIYLRRKYRYDAIRAVYTIHNIEYQGVYGKEILGDVFGLGDEDFPIVDFNGCINLTKGAIVCCDKLTTVSQKYSEEIRTPYFAHGLHSIISDYGYKTCGIVNGIDYDYYNPKNDPVLPAPGYSANYRTFAGKAQNKEALQKLFSLPANPDVPVISMISRLAPHKGLDIVKSALEDFIYHTDVQFIVLGTGEYEYENYFRYLADKYPQKVVACIQFDKVLAKQVYAGSDIFLMPSKSEPCGLSQMIASRYGAVPVVRETGGLYDTGVTFFSYDPGELLIALGRTLELYYDKVQWKKLVRNAMNSDFTWGASAAKYLELYKNLG